MNIHQDNKTRRETVFAAVGIDAATHIDFMLRHHGPIPEVQYPVVRQGMTYTGAVNVTYPMPYPKAQRISRSRDQI
jgi:hypothetical protein